MDEARFNPNHFSAGAKGGQFAPAGGGGGGGGKAQGKAPAKPAPGHGHGHDGGQAAPKPPSTPREKLLAEAHADRERARELEKHLHDLEHQHDQAVAAAKHSAAQAAQAKKAGHTVHHRKHSAAHKHHRKHAATLAQRIAHLRTEIHTLRQKAAALEKQAKGKRDEAPAISVAERLSAAAAERDVSELQFGHGSALWKYWTTGKGFAKWSGSLHKWTTLRALLLKAGVPAHSVDGLTTNIIMAVMPGYMKQAHAQGHKSAEVPGMDRADAKKPYGDVAYADPGYLDADGNQASKSGKPGVKRYQLSADKVMAAWSCINQKDNAAQYTPDQLKAIKGRIKAAMGRHGHDVSMNSASPDGEYRTVPLAAPMDVSSNGDGLTFEGYAAVYNRTARIAASDGDFDEQIMHGAFRDIAAGNYPRLMFEHGRHPLIGTMPLGKITDAREDDIGLWIEARLTDNWLISPVRDAVANGALDGMSFRFTVNDGGEMWMDRSGDVPLRSLTSLSVPELGPVVFPAYEPTTASVRSVLDQLPVIGRPPAGARAASGREGDAPERAEPNPSLAYRFRADGEELALRGIEGVRL